MHIVLMMTHNYPCVWLDELNLLHHPSREIGGIEKYGGRETVVWEMGVRASEMLICDEGDAEIHWG